MEKKLIKAILDIIKDVSDRPSVYGAEIHKGYIYFSNGYIAVRLHMGEYEGLRVFPMCEHVWVGGEQLKGAYKDMTTKDVYDRVHNDGENHIDLVNFWEQWNKDREDTNVVAINPEVFKKLVPFGTMLMRLTSGKDGSMKLVKFSGRGVEAVACPMSAQIEKELNNEN